MVKLQNNDETWEMLHLASGIYIVGQPYPSINFDFYIEDVSEKNAYCSNEGIKRQIKEVLELRPDKERVVYFYYKRNAL